MRTRMKLALSLTVVSLVLGFMVALQYKQTEKASELGLGAGVSTAEDKRLLANLNDLKKANVDAETVLAKVTLQVSDFEKKSSGASSGLENTEKLLQDERILAGITPVYGPGVSVTLMDGSASGSDVEQVLTHDWNVRSVINELFTAGAEAVSINGYRVVTTSGIFCRGPVVTVNDHRLGAPFRIDAIGDPQTLKSALEIQGGILDLLRANGLRVSDPTTVTKLTLPAFTGAVQASNSVH